MRVAVGVLRTGPYTAAVPSAGDAVRSRRRLIAGRASGVAVAARNADARVGEARGRRYAVRRVVVGELVVAAFGVARARRAREMKRLAALIGRIAIAALSGAVVGIGGLVVAVALSLRARLCIAAL